MEGEEYHMIFKIILVGDSFVGKTNILGKYLNNEFSEDTKATVGVEFGNKVYNFDGKIVKAQIWDTAGQERYKSITNAYFKGARGAFVVYDITKPETFQSIDKWIPDLKANGSKDISILLIGNKADLEDKRKVKREDAETKAKHYGVAFMETSALSGKGLDEAFNTMMQDVYQKCRHEFEGDGVDIGVGKNIELEDNKEELDSAQERGCCKL